MAMVVHNNMDGIFTLNRLNKNSSNMAKDLQKVSTGMKVVGAGDDSSAYAISERMRVRIRSLDQCNDNTKLGWNMIQVASKGVEEQISVVTKLREIAMKASDDTYAQKDRDVLQREATQLFEQVDNIAQETNYNGKQVLVGKTTSMVSVYNPNKLNFNASGGFVANTGAQGITNSFTFGSGVVVTGVVATPNHFIGVAPKSSSASSAADNLCTLDFSGYTSSSGGNLMDDFDLQGFSIGCNAGCGNFVSVVFTKDRALGYGERLDDSGSSCSYVIGIQGASNVDDIEDAVYTGVVAANQAKPRAGLGDHTMLPNHNVRIAHPSNGVVTITQDMSTIVFGDGVKGISSERGGYEDVPKISPYQDISIQADPAGSQNTKVRLFNTTAEVLFPPNDTEYSLNPNDPGDYPKYPSGYSSDYSNLTEAKAKEKWRNEEWPYPKPTTLDMKTCLRTRENASKFVDMTDQAIKYLLHVATSLGAQQNRMDNASANLVTASENTSAAESTIRDADMAKEMVSFTKNNILLTASQAMLTHANQDAGNVLALLQ